VSAKPKNRAGRARRSGIKKGYGDCAILVDGIAILWRDGVRPGHELVAETLQEVAKQIRMLRESI
jgi:hypothetical protein